MQRGRIFLWILFPLIFCSCGKNNTAVHKISGGDTLTVASKYLQLVDFGNYTLAEIAVPWSDSVPVGKYAIVHTDDKTIDIPEGYQIIRAPLQRSVVFSSIYVSGITELGKLGSVAAVTDKSYYLPGDTVISLIETNDIADVGSSMSPLIEDIIDIDPDAILLSIYAGVSSVGVERIGVPLVWMADYLETSPLARAEWILLLGELFDESQKARAIYTEVTNNYNRIKDRISGVATRPTVIVEKPMSGAWYVPGGESYIAKMLADAGAFFPWNDNDISGSIAIDEAAVIDKGETADFWLIKDTKDFTSSELLKEVPRAKALAPFPDNIYLCNTLHTPYYNVIAFHPDKILVDMASIFHPSLIEGTDVKFYKKVL